MNEMFYETFVIIIIDRCGKNYGWRMFEGSRCNDGFEDYDGAGCADLDRADYAFPSFEYCHFDYDSASEEYDVCGDRAVTGLSIIGESGHNTNKCMLSRYYV